MSHRSPAIDRNARTAAEKVKRESSPCLRVARDSRIHGLAPHSTVDPKAVALSGRCNRSGYPQSGEQLRCFVLSDR